MKTRLRRWALWIVAAVAIPAAVIVPAASSASAAVTQPSVGVWINLQAYPGTYPLDELDCVLGYLDYWSHVYPLTPESDFRCYGQLYSPNLGNYYELQMFVS